MVICIGLVLGGNAYAQITVTPPVITRFSQNPIITPEMLPGIDGDNINGPSLIKVPSWLPNPLGQYYLYFAHHKGDYIRLAYSDQLEGPWTVYEPGTLKINDVIASSGGMLKLLSGSHIASPDVHVDDVNQQIKMYFHGKIGPFTRWGHSTGVAISQDGISFVPVIKPGDAYPKPLGPPYFRVFQFEGYYYAITRVGSLMRSLDGINNWEDLNPTFAEATTDTAIVGTKTIIRSMRHSAVKLDGNVLSVYFSRVGDRPESIMLAKVELVGDWTTWKLTPGITVLQPEMDWEGINFPNKVSDDGAQVNVRQLRDPYIYREDAQTFLLYSVKGELGIAIADLID